MNFHSIKKNNLGFTIIELMFAVAAFTIVSISVYNLLIQQSIFRAENLAKINSENNLVSIVLRLETEFRTALQGSPGATLVNQQLFNINRMNPNDPAKYSRVVYSAKCQNIPATSAIRKAGFVNFSAPSECSGSAYVCATGMRPILEISNYPDFSASSTPSTVKVEPSYDGTVKTGLSLFEQPIAVSMCVTSPGTSELDLIAGYFYAYYVNSAKKIAMVKRKFMVSRTPPVSGVQYIPNN